jgi:hypothetical protein
MLARQGQLQLAFDEVPHGNSSGYSTPILGREVSNF